MQQHREPRTGLGELSQPTTDRFDSRAMVTDCDSGPWVKHMKVIKFTGNMKENIAELLTGIDCRCGLKKDYSQIIGAYGDKITRLREDRAKYKENLTQEKLRNECLQEQLKKINRENRTLEDSYFQLGKETVPRDDFLRLQQEKKQLEERYCELQKDYQQIAHQCRQLQEAAKTASSHPPPRTKKVLTTEGSHDDSDLLDSMNYTNEDIAKTELADSENELLRLRLQAYQKLEKELNMDSNELVALMREYAGDIPTFASREERQLFLLAKRMNSNLWNRKLQAEIKELHQRQEQMRRLEAEAKKKSAQ